MDPRTAEAWMVSLCCLLLVGATLQLLPSWLAATDSTLAAASALNASFSEVRRLVRLRPAYGNA